MSFSLSTASSWRRAELWALALFVFALCLALNWRFVEWVSPAKIAEMNDAPGILAGYDQTPNLFVDGWKWFRGPWIQEGIGPFLRFCCGSNALWERVLDLDWSLWSGWGCSSSFAVCAPL